MNILLHTKYNKIVCIKNYTFFSLSLNWIIIEQCIYVFCILNKNYIDVYNDGGSIQSVKV